MLRFRPKNLRSILGEAMPGTEWSDDAIDGAAEEIAEHFSRAIGQFGWSSFNARRGVLRENFDLLIESLDTVQSILASSGDLRKKIDIDLLGFIANVAIEANPELTPAAMNRKFADGHAHVRDILVDVKAARTVLEQTSADGPARQSWYDPVIAGAVAIAQSLAIPLATGGDRSRNPSDTPFVCLLMGLETFLPRDMQSESYGACAKRIERSPAWPSAR